MFKALSCGKPLNTSFCCLLSVCVVLGIEPMALHCLAHAITEVKALVCVQFLDSDGLIFRTYDVIPE